MWLALAVLATFAAPAYSQIVIDSTGTGPVVIERDKSANAGPGGDGIVVHVGKMDIHTGGEVLNFSHFEKPSVELSNFDRPGAPGEISVKIYLPKVYSASRNDAEQIADLTVLMHRLNDAATRQCEPIVAVFGKPCRLSELNMRGYFEPRSIEGRQNGAGTDSRFEIAPNGAAVANPN